MNRAQGHYVRHAGTLPIPLCAFTLASVNNPRTGQKQSAINFSILERNTEANNIENFIPLHGLYDVNF